MSYAIIDSLAGFPAITSLNVCDTVQKYPLGTLVKGIDPFWGPGEFMYVRFPGAVRQFGLCALKGALQGSVYEVQAPEIPNTANLAVAVGIAQAQAAAGTFGWVMLHGISPVNCSASVAADTTFGIAAAGQGGANSAGKQLLGARIVAPATTTVVKQGVAQSGATKLKVPSTDGWFVGAYMSGTGIAAGTTITGVDPDGTVTLSAATTAAVAGAVTATYNNAAVFYNVAYINRPNAQGAIT